MSNKETGGPAFPQPIISTAMGDIVSSQDCNEGGVTMRDYFAAKAMQGICSGRSHSDLRGHVIASSRVAYLMADAMLEARK